jgi:hypothetical protein
VTFRAKSEVSETVSRTSENCGTDGDVASSHVLAAEGARASIDLDECDRMQRRQQRLLPTDGVEHPDMSGRGSGSRQPLLARIVVPDDERQNGESIMQYLIVEFSGMAKNQWPLSSRFSPHSNQTPGDRACVLLITRSTALLGLLRGIDTRDFGKESSVAGTGFLGCQRKN